MKQEDRCKLALVIAAFSAGLGLIGFIIPMWILGIIFGVCSLVLVIIDRKKINRIYLPIILSCFGILASTAWLIYVSVR